MHFALTLPVALWLLTAAEHLAVLPLAAGAFYVVLALTNVGGVLEGRRWALTAEQARLGALGSAAVGLLAYNEAPRVVSVAMLLGCAVSALVLWQHRGAFTRSSDERMDHEHQHVRVG
jgi:hypothetical protein